MRSRRHGSPPPAPAPSDSAGSPAAPPPRRRPRRGGRFRISPAAAFALLLAACAALSAFSTVRLRGRARRGRTDERGAAGGDIVGGRRGPVGRRRRRRGRGGGGPSAAKDGGVGDGERTAVDSGGNGNGGDVRSDGGDADGGRSGRSDHGSGSGSGDGGGVAPSRGLAACLLTNDENPRLPEWIAYHYHVLPLRHLVVAADPASRSSPAEILDRWRRLAGLDAKLWGDEDFMPKEDAWGTEMRACGEGDEEEDCLWRHRKRQRHFVNKCMADFHRRNLTWTLLVDVDEYITFNRVHDDDPAPPLDAAPEGVPTLAGWTRKEFNLVDSETHEVVSEVHIEGTASGLPEGGLNGTKNGDHVTFTSKNYSYEYDTTYGNVVDDARTGGRWFLRDDHAFRDMVELTAAPYGLPTLRDARFVRGDVLSAKIYNDTYSGRRDGEVVEVRTHWRESPDGTSTALGGHLMHAEDGRTYFVERRRPLWPPLFTSEKALEIRNRLPSVGDDTTILDILEGESEGERFAEVVGPCLSMPRLLYGPHEREKDADGQGETLPDGFDRHDFVTLRYRWHAAKEARANKFQKVIIDVSRMSARNFLGEAKNIHVPLHYYCRKYPPRYSTSFFRVNHYLDSFEAFSYRNDARSSKRCKECWEEKGKDAAAFMDDDMAPWLNSFVHAMGHQKAKDLLSGAGNFVQLPLT